MKHSYLIRRIQLKHSNRLTLEEGHFANCLASALMNQIIKIQHTTIISLCYLIFLSCTIL